jgi:hypothetical protein
MTFAKTILQKTINFLKSLKGICLSPCKVQNSLQTRCSLLGTHILATIACKLHHEDVHLKMPFSHPNDAPSNPLILIKHSLL